MTSRIPTVWPHRAQNEFDCGEECCSAVGTTRRGSIIRSAKSRESMTKITQRCGHILWSSPRVFLPQNEVSSWNQLTMILSQQMMHPCLNESCNHAQSLKYIERRWIKGNELCSPINTTLGLLDSERIWDSSVHEMKGVVDSSCVVDDSCRKDRAWVTTSAMHIKAYKMKWKYLFSWPG